MSVQLVIDAINEGKTVDEVNALVDEHGIDVDEPVGEMRLRAIHHSVFKDRIDCVKFLRERGCDINARDQCGYTPLHIAARYNRTTIAKVILGMGANVDAPDSLGCAPLHLALQKGHHCCAEVLLQNGAEPNAYYKNIGYEIHTLPGISPDCLELLLKYGADANVRDYRGLTPLHHATRAGNTLYVYILLKHGADPDATTPDDAPFPDGRTALQMAVFSNSRSIVEMLLLCGANPNCKDEHRNTPLHHATARGNIAIAKLLISRGAFISAANTLRYYPLHRACSAGVDSDMIALLLENGAFVNSTTCLNDTPLKCVLSHWKQSIDENDNNNTNDDEDELKLKQYDDACIRQVLTLLDYGAIITITNCASDPYSVLPSFPSILRMPRTVSLLVDASSKTFLIGKKGTIPAEFETSEMAEVVNAAKNPLSLRQACRLVIREAIGNSKITEAVETLPLPTILKGYMLFRTFNKI